MSEAKEFQLGYRVDLIQTLKFSFEDIDEEELVNLMKDPKGLEININIRVKIKKETSTFILDVSSELFNFKEKSLLVQHIGRTSFFIQGLESTSREEGKSFDLPSKILVQMYGIAFTHSRALLSVDLSPTVYRNRYMLPVVDPYTLIPNREVSEG
jgi:hypothetical protein